MKWMTRGRGHLACALLLCGLGACSDDDDTNTGDEGLGGTGALAGGTGGAGSDAGSGGGEGSGGDDGCTEPLVLLCDGDDIVMLDRCTDSRTVQERCTGACVQAECVDCAPGAGAACDGDTVWELDSCGAATALVETCPGRCAMGACVPESCQPNAGRACVEDTPFYEDSCGNRGEQAADACTGGCTDGACGECMPSDFVICFQGDIWSIDSCGRPTVVSTDCGADSCVLDAGTISCEAGRDCQDSGRYVCVDGIAYLGDTCGGSGGEPQPFSCFPCTPGPLGRVCDGKDVVELVGGCVAGDASLGAVLETCEYSCSAGECQQACAPNAGVTCNAGDSYAVDACGGLGDLVEACDDGPCELGRCMDCSGTSNTCVGTDLHEVDGCGRIGPLVMACQNACVDGRCMGQPPGELVCDCEDGFPFACGLYPAGGDEGPFASCSGCWDSGDGTGPCQEPELCKSVCGDGVTCTGGFDLYGPGEAYLGSCLQVDCIDGCADPKLCQAFNCGG